MQCSYPAAAKFETKRIRQVLKNLEMLCKAYNEKENMEALKSTPATQVKTPRVVSWLSSSSPPPLRRRAWLKLASDQLCGKR